MFEDIKAMAEEMANMSDEDRELVKQQQIALMRHAFTWPVIKETLLALGLGILIATGAFLALMAGGHFV